MNLRKTFSILLLFAICCVAIFAQQETLVNSDVVSMNRAGLSENLIARKIKDSNANFQTKTQDLIDLKKAGVSDRIIGLMLDKNAGKISTQKQITNLPDSNSTQAAVYTQNNYQPHTPRIVLSKREALKNAKTIAIHKSSLHPSRQALEKELMKREDWRDLNLNIVRHKDNADLYIEIGYVSMSWITHRYVYRVFDRKSGTVILAGETTSWGALAKNLARGITLRLSKAVASAKQT